MKKIETIKAGKNYSAVSVGNMSEIIEHELPMGPDFTLKGKVFAGQAVGATGSELSFQTLVPGQDSGFLHTLEKPSAFDPRGQATLTLTGKIRMTLCGKIKLTPECDCHSGAFL